ncbi:MAG: Calx-beta domain-containing protein [Panacagrimonas sp.]
MRAISFRPGRAMLTAGLLCLAICAQASCTLVEREGGPERSEQVTPGETPKGLSTTEWASIQAQIEQSRYRLESVEQGVTGANPEQGWNLAFDERGLSLDNAESVTSDVGRFKPQAEPTSGPSRVIAASLVANPSPPASVGSAREQHAGLTRPTPIAVDRELRLRTTAIGRVGVMTAVTGATPVVRDNKVELHHAQATEWFVNSALGLEHGYTFEQAPRGERGEVRIELAVEGAFKVQPAEGDGVWFADASGKQRMRYHKLLVVDANNKKLDARLDVKTDDRMQIAFDDSRASYPVTVDPLLVNQEAQLVADDGEEQDEFGYSVAVHGDTAVIGADHDVVAGKTQHGSAYVFVRSSNGSWSQQAHLFASDGDAGDLFGRSVSVFGDIAVVGAILKNVGTIRDQGAAYVFVRGTNGNWTQEFQLLADDGARGDLFGYSVSISGNAIVVGATTADIGSNQSQGAAYVFHRLTNHTWLQKAKLVAVDGATDDQFGWSVSISGDVIAVGAWLDDVGSNFAQGSAHVFVRSGGTWIFQSTLLADDSAAGDSFGYSVAVSGESIVVGAAQDSVGAFTRLGSAYVFVRNAGAWIQQAQLLPSEREDHAQFGTAVALSGDTAVVGAYNQTVASNLGQGVAYVFTRSGSAWSEQGKLLATDGAAADNFADAVALSGDTAVIGAHRDNVGPKINQGAAYVYRFATARDFGDAPDPSYPSLLASNGARHALNGPKLGSTIDAETDAQTNSGATADDIAGIDDEDGVQFGSLTAGQSATVGVTVTDGPAKIDAWIDFNRDGDWADAGEQVFNDFNVVNGVNSGLSFAVPAAAVAGITYARVRLSSTGVASFTGEAPDGEVEDEQVTLIRPPVGAIQFSAAAYSVNESQSTARITLTRTGGSFGAASMVIRSGGGSATAGSDYTSITSTVNWADGDSSNKTLDITINNDTTQESNETVNLTASDATGATLGTRSTAVLTIIDNDEPPIDRTISVADMSADEGNSGARLFRFTVSLSVAASGPISVGYATVNGTATAGSDYHAGSGTVSFGAGERVKSVDTVVRGDTTGEPNETFFVNLSNPVGATIADGHGIGTIRNDDVAPLPTITIDDVPNAELNSGTRNFTFTIRLSAPSSGPVSVSYVTANGSATAGSDYNSGSGTVSIAAGQTAQTVGIGVRGDTAVEPDETFFVNLSGPVGATIADGTGTGTIVNDDAPPDLPSIQISNVSATEGASGTTKTVNFTVTLSRSSTQSVTVNYATANATAVAPTDYTAKSGALSFPPGTLSKSVGVVLKGDSTRESDETFQVNLSGPANATIGDGQGIGTIRNDD